LHYSTHGGNRYRGREAAWEARRKHSLCPMRIIPSWGMDCIFLRTPSEADYVKALWAYTAQNPAVGELTVCREYLMESKPFLPLPWPPSGRKSSNPEAEFSQKGQLLVPPERHPRDSSYALYLGSLMAGHGCNAIFPSRVVNFSRNRPFEISTPTFYSWSNNTIHPRNTLANYHRVLIYHPCHGPTPDLAGFLQRRLTLPPTDDALAPAYA
jgi:hypothetical protein